MKPILLLLACLIIGSCAEKPTETTPPIDDEANLQPGRRDYVWHYDTLDTGGDWLSGFWGFSPTNVWCRAVGERILWHYNGTQWRRFNISNFFLTPGCIFGLSDTDVWFLGYEFYALRYNGHSFVRMSLPRPPNYDHISITSVWGEKSNELYAVGTIYNTAISAFHQVIMKFNGQEWNIERISDIRGNLYFIGNDTKNGMIYIVGTKAHADGIGYTGVIYEYKNGNLNEIYTEEHILYSRNTLTNGRAVLFKTSRMENHFKRFENRNFVIWKNMTNDTVMFAGVIGRHEKDFFTATFDYSSNLLRSRIWHYNGEDFHPVFEGYDVAYTGILVMPKDIMFPVRLPDGKMLVVRGTLPDTTNKNQ